MNLETVQGERAVAARPTQAQAAEANVAPDDLERPVVQKPLPADSADEAPASLFTPDAARDFRASWDAVQIGFVDDPERAVRQADELVRQMLQNLQQTFSEERAGLDARGEGAADAASTEKLRLALRRYRAFMQRLLSL
ncbi:hypothetical protein [Variovorax soli]|jgi:hypothetical protein|uniref:Uncharacterized protein n=1 Tax=Variovorax soli TaxID=376815 RepID=A0ABU1NB86_9BURK|nr:hypothetical protein [Variovorax soli]MDR6535704.1 hypothetical protein [Variovorax soli]